MVEMVIIIVLAIGLVLVSVAAVGAMLWMRHREQKHDMALRNTEVFAQLDHALNNALKEIDKKNLALLSLYSKLGEPKKALVTTLLEADEPTLSTTNEIESPIKRGRGRPRKTPIVVNASMESTNEASMVSHDEILDVARPKAPKPKPLPRKFSGNAKHKKVLDLRAQGLIIPDIAKKLSISQSEVTLILEKAEARNA